MSFCPSSVLCFRKKLCTFGAFYLPPPTEAPSFKRRLSKVSLRDNLRITRPITRRFTPPSPNKECLIGSGSAAF